MDVVVGTNSLKEGGKRYAVEEYKVNPGYKWDSHGSDIAVVRVKEDIEFNSRVQPISYSSEEFPDEVEALLTGWGRVEVSISNFFTFFFGSL